MTCCTYGRTDIPTSSITDMERLRQGTDGERERLEEKEAGTGASIPVAVEQSLGSKRREGRRTKRRASKEVETCSRMCL